MITIHLTPDGILATMLAAALIAVVLSRVLGGEKAHKRSKTNRSPKEIDKLEKELARIKKALKN